MTEHEFRRRVAALGITSRALPAARKILVDGAGIREQARQCGVNPGYLLRLVQRIRATTVCECCGQAIRPPPRE